MFYFGRVGAEGNKEVIPCIIKAIEMKYLYSNVMTVLANRMLKLLLELLRHSITLEQELADLFGKINSLCEERGLTDNHKLTSLRLSKVSKELQKLNIDVDAKETKLKQFIS